MSRGMTLFESLDFVVQPVLSVFQGLTDLASGLISLFCSGFLVRFMDLLRGVFRVAQGFLYRTFGLVGNSFVG